MSRSELRGRSWWLTPATSSHYTARCPHVNTPPVTLPGSSWQGARLTGRVWVCANSSAAICTSLFTLVHVCVCALMPVHGLHGLHVLLCASSSAGRGCWGWWTTADQRECTLAGVNAKEGGGRRRHVAHAVIEQWRSAVLPPPLCQSVIILVFSQHFTSVPLQWNSKADPSGTVPNTHTHDGDDTLGNFSAQHSQ